MVLFPRWPDLYLYFACRFVTHDDLHVSAVAAVALQIPSKNQHCSTEKIQGSSMTERLLGSGQRQKAVALAHLVNLQDSVVNVAGFVETDLAES